MAQNDWENADWLEKLNSEGAQQVEATEELRHLLLRAALYTFSRNLHDLHHRAREDVFALAEDCAQEALFAVMQQLAAFRGESRFTTWAYKFAVHKALETARRERWRSTSLDELLESTEHCQWITDRDTPAGESSDSAAQAEIWRMIQHVICDELTERQRQVVKLMIFDEVPMDVVTERFHTNRNAVYKLLHDARKRIRRRLEMHGYSTDEVLALFSTPLPHEADELPGGECA